MRFFEYDQEATSRLGAPVELANFDIVVANIIARPLRRLATLLADMTIPGGKIALAGLLSEQAESVMDAYRPYFDIHIAEEKDGWTLLKGTKI